jgi:CubicO group peptidase (beta-lactamase class C family)
MTRLEARQRIFAQQLVFEPGTKQAYSNSGYTLLADVVETVSGRPFTDYIRDELLVPAEMKQSGFYRDAVWQKVDTAIGYDASKFEDNDPATWQYTWSFVGNGGLVTTVSDLALFVTSLWSGGILAASAFDMYQRDYLSHQATDIAGKTVYVSAGAGDYGLGGLLLDCPQENTRVIIGTNTHERFDIEPFGIELGSFVLSAR